MRIANKVKEIKTDKMIHKIATKLSVDDAGMFLLNRSLEKEFNEYNAIYWDGSSQYKTFRPYILKKEEH